MKEKPPSGPTRRDFVEGAAYGTLGMVLGLADGDAAEAGPTMPSFRAAKPSSRLVLVRDAKAVDEANHCAPQVVQSMVDQAICRLTGAAEPAAAWRHFISPKDVVGIKITRCTWMRVGTEQVVVDAIAKRLAELGLSAEKIIVRDDGMPLDRCTALINVPAIKVHSVTGFAGALKNYINFSSTPQKYHHANNKMLGEVWLQAQVKDKTRVVIADLLRPYFGPGPQINPAYRWNYRGVMVGTDPVAIDTVALAICRAKRRQHRGEEWPITPPPLQLADAESRYKLGVADPDKISLVREGWSQELLL